MPLMIERLPFLIGSPNASRGAHRPGQPAREPDRGRTMFRDHGGNTEFLERINGVLAIAPGHRSTPAFIVALLEHNLLESFVLDIQFTTGRSTASPGSTPSRRSGSNARRGGAPERCTRRVTCRPSTWRSPPSRTSAILIERAEPLECCRPLNNREIAGFDRTRCRTNC